MRPDFGPGFYATTWLHQAKTWATVRCNRLARKHRGNRAIVLQFSVKRDALAALDSLVFTNDQSDYYPFVSYCRGGGSPHNRTVPHRTDYDVVYGPVSLGIQRLVVKDADQVSFHTAAAIKIIPSVTVVATGSPTFP